MRRGTHHQKRDGASLSARSCRRRLQTRASKIDGGEIKTKKLLREPRSLRPRIGGGGRITAGVRTRWLARAGGVGGVRRDFRERRGDRGRGVRGHFVAFVTGVATPRFETGAASADHWWGGRFQHRERHRDAAMWRIEPSDSSREVRTGKGEGRGNRAGEGSFKKPHRQTTPGKGAECGFW